MSESDLFIQIETGLQRAGLLLHAKRLQDDDRDDVRDAADGLEHRLMQWAPTVAVPACLVGELVELASAEIEEMALGIADGTEFALAAGPAITEMATVRDLLEGGPGR